ncbi:MBL fold metallo-hydrolase [Sinanaerobacter chloroacetimidivorans]|jgi:hydroxyacylglutathione hydrolase|uniref:MBL fold metallo-hydrolase n=1 Tax=Sinanaerobacter chloroacetimidivorans TaxID=2818044 RepID=A0A8J7VX35_9FIRM|nr:MBL fold metallo-hydrolase [Sinanaerobacter chloroacetimidivorans]MBR0596657.1 MBL fold metallo-hydrolase [Sinanaerobacter chloroacetimidivorans]
MIIKNYLSGPLSVNSYLVVDEKTKKAFIVDPGGHNVNMVSNIKENGYHIEYIILTHGHGDHIGGVPAYQKEFPGAKLVAGKLEQEMLRNAKMNFSQELSGIPVSLNPDILVADGDTLMVGNLELKFLFTPGHTVGGISILAEDALFSGDTLFAQSIGRTDFPGSSFAAIKSSIENKLYTLPDQTTVYPGHMGTTTIGFEKENNPFV